MVMAFGDSQFLNAALFENYLSQYLYYDDDMEKTASYAEAFSLDECNESYIAVKQDYAIRQFSYLPSVSFRAQTTQEHKFKEKFAYPKLFRSINFETKRNEEILDSLLDLKVKKTAKYASKKKSDDNANDVKDSLRDTERVTSESYMIQSSMRNRDFKQDVLPYIYQIIHP